MILWNRYIYHKAIQSSPRHKLIFKVFIHDNTLNVYKQEKCKEDTRVFASSLILEIRKLNHHHPHSSVSHLLWVNTDKTNKRPRNGSTFYLEIQYKPYLATTTLSRE